MNPIHLILCGIILLSSLGVILLKKPVHACLSFLLTLVTLATIYIQFYAPFIAAMQVLVYAGAILVIFMFVIVLFQDAYLAINEFKANSKPLWIAVCGLLFIGTLTLLGTHLTQINYIPQTLPIGYGSVETIGKALYLDFFFPFEAVGILFLVAIVGALYIGKKV